MIDLVRRFVVPEWCGYRRYMKLLGAFLRFPDYEAIRFGRGLAKDARRITDHELGVLLDGEWRARLTAAWLIALDRRIHFRGRLAGLLLESEVVHAGAGYCVALARFGEAEDADIPCAYLDRYLRQKHYALGALMVMDEKLGTSHADRFLNPGGLWETFAMDGISAETCRRAMGERVAFAANAMNGTLPQWAAQRER
ncbi:DUF6000 family protein [Herbidospora daliensis]|uniref:DUF6000 family protein n=1 Tax=Herbidospora daliensis TaxID=295585 RepID=UPI000B2F7BCF|nr:DUF6000 family protein [Herbidospora daliensis]